MGVAADIVDGVKLSNTHFTGEQHLVPKTAAGGCFMPHGILTQHASNIIFFMYSNKTRNTQNNVLTTVVWFLIKQEKHKSSMWSRNICHVMKYMYIAIVVYNCSWNIVWQRVPAVCNWKILQMPPALHISASHWTTSCYKVGMAHGHYLFPMLKLHNKKNMDVYTT